MKIVQLVAAHVEQGAEPSVFGLDEEGNLWEWMPEIKPVVGQRQKLEEVPQAELEKISPWHRHMIDGKMMRPMVDPITKQQMLEPVYSDGCTAGWKCLGQKMSKPVPHPEDPTRHNRS